MLYKRIPQLLLIAALVMSAFGFTAPQQVPVAKVQPQLLVLATQNPDQTVQVIVQKAAQMSLAGTARILCNIANKFADLDTVQRLASRAD